MKSSLTLPTDRRQPWIGLTPYHEVDSELFFGREEECLELLRLVRREVLTVLFGPSGTGKTSLLNAGLFPRLRESSFLPIAIRLDHLGDLPDYSGQVRTLIAEALHADATHPIEVETLAPQQAEQETLWEYLHRVVFWDWRNNPVTPVLVLDQFEEIFTLGQNRAATEGFLTVLADMVENYIPAAVRSRMEAHGGGIPFPDDQPRFKVVLSLREDFVWRLDGLRKRMPSVMRNRFSIARMNGEQALLAVRKPGQGIVEDPVGQHIVRFVAAANHSRAAAEDEDVPFDSLQVDPALLSVVCRELNARRIEQEKNQITDDLLEQAGTDILNDFYDRGFEGLNPSVRVFVEDRLLTTSGFRSTVPLEEATQTGIAAEDIRTLVDRRLIRLEERLGIPHLELTHDLLTKVVQKSRSERQARDKLEHERRQRETEGRERVERVEREQAKLRADVMAAAAKRLRRGLVALATALALAIVASVYAFLQRANAENSYKKSLLAAASAASAQFSLLAQKGKDQPGCMLPPPQPSHQPSSSPNQFRPPIKHLIVLMMENRSFDHMLGSLRAVNPQIDGVTDQVSNLDTTGAPVNPQPLADFQGQLNPDPDHYFASVDLQIFGGDTSASRVANMQGFVKSYFKQRPDVAHSHMIMYYFTPDKLPVLATLAKEFAVCDRWFSSVPGPSIPNRAFAHYGTSFGHVDMDLIYASGSYRSIYVRMKENGRTAKVYYYDATSSTMEVANLLQNQPEFFGTFMQFLNDASNGRLPEYSFVEPNFNDHDSDEGIQIASDEHPDHSVQAGELFIAGVYNAIRKNETLWRNSILLITYSNHGGIYDHVPPPAATPDGFVAQPEQTGTGRSFAFDRLGVRVPAVIVSPWIPKGTIDHTVYDHSSIPATASKLFLSGSQSSSPRERSAHTFDHVLTLKTMRTDTPDFRP